MRLASKNSYSVPDLARQGCLKQSAGALPIDDLKKPLDSFIKICNKRLKRQAGQLEPYTACARAIILSRGSYAGKYNHAG